MTLYDERTIQMLEAKANILRRHVIKMTYAAQSGHPGGSLSYADIITALFFKVMRFRPQEPMWEDRDKFVLSKGHAAPVYYAALAEAGYFPVEDLLSLRKLGSYLQGHPCRMKTPGVEISTGSLGQGLSVANGWDWPQAGPTFVAHLLPPRGWGALRRTELGGGDAGIALQTGQRHRLRGPQQDADRQAALAESCPWSLWSTSGRPLDGTS